MPASDVSLLDLRALIRDIPDFPKPGILFRDVTPLLGNGPALRACVRQLCHRLAPAQPHAVAGIESRGFIFGAPVAAELGIGFVPIRKPGKLPWKTRKESYALEYGTDAIEVHEDAVARGEYAPDVLGSELASSDLHQSPNNVSHHVAKEAPSCHLIHQHGGFRAPENARAKDDAHARFGVFVLLRVGGCE